MTRQGISPCRAVCLALGLIDQPVQYGTMTTLLSDEGGTGEGCEGNATAGK